MLLDHVLFHISMHEILKFKMQVYRSCCIEVQTKHAYVLN